jgi:hypothetical protein
LLAFKRVVSTLLERQKISSVNGASGESNRHSQQKVNGLGIFEWI